MNYTFGDFLIRIKNGYMAHKKEVELPYSKQALNIGKILVKNEYLKSVKEVDLDGKKRIFAVLSYTDHKGAIENVEIISKPSVHHYVPKRKITATRGGFGISLISTSKGIMTDKEARKAGVGGEVICRIY